MNYYIGASVCCIVSELSPIMRICADDINFLASCPLNEMKPYRSPGIRHLIRQRRQTRDADERRVISKQLFRETRKAYRK